jgi:membrane protease YdiL (CAAX protease family)
MRRKILEMALVFLLFIPLPLYFIPGAAEASQQASPQASAAIVIQMISYIIMTIPQIGVLLYVLFLQKTPLTAFGMKRPTAATFGWMAIGWGGALLTMMMFLSLFSLFPEGVRENLLREQPLKISSPAEIPLMVLFCLAVGYREELIFRSYLFTRLGELGVKPAWAIAGISVVFGAAHFSQGVLGMATTCAIGVFFGVMYSLRQDLHAVAGAHALYNITLFVFSFIGTNRYF